MLLTNFIFLIFWAVGFAGTLRNLWAKLISKLRSLKKDGSVHDNPSEIEVIEKDS